MTLRFCGGDIHARFRSKALKESKRKLYRKCNENSRYELLLGRSGKIDSKYKWLALFVTVGLITLVVTYKMSEEEHKPPHSPETHKAVFKPLSEINPDDYNGEIPLIPDENFSQRSKDDYFADRHPVLDELVQITDEKIKETENSVLAVADTVQNEVQKYNNAHGIVSCYLHAKYMSTLMKKCFSELGLPAYAWRTNASIGSKINHAETLVFNSLENQLYVPYSVVDNISKFEKSCYKVPGDPWSELPPENKTIALEYDEMKRRFGPENAKKFLISELLQPFDAQFDQTKIGENRWVIASFHNRVTMVDKTAKYLENYLVNRGPDYDIARRIQSFFEYPALISEIPQIWKYPRGELILIGEGKDLTYLQTLYVNLFHAIRSGENKKLEELLEDLYLKS